MSGRLRAVLFSTTNSSKFVQARLALGRFGVDVEQLQSHTQPYPEPYGLSRRTFLNVGLSAVLDRAGRSRFVFIEDTTVRIEALSSEGEDVPGQRTKEWYAETNLAELLSEFVGGCLEATVRSDIALHIPGADDPVLFVGRTKGQVLKRVEQILPNALYPWLGRDDFSSWFVPDGADRPLAAMSYEESLGYDFRDKALNLLSARLLEYKAVANSSRSLLESRQPRFSLGQLSLMPVPGEHLLVVITGPPGAGKTTAAHYLQLHHGFHLVEASRALSEVTSSLGIDGHDNFERADLLFLREGHDAVERMAVWPRFEELGGPMVYSGARTPEGLEYLRAKAREAGATFRIIAVNAPLNVRYSRAVERARHGVGQVSDFEKLSERDEGYGAAAAGRASADARVTNAGTLETFVARLNRVVGRFA